MSSPIRIQALFPLLLAASSVAQAAPVKKPVTEADYGRWESLGATSVSPGGRWLAYGVNRVDGKSELRLRMLATESTETFAYGSGAKFSADDRWLGFSIGVSEDQREKLREQKKPVRQKLGLFGLVDGKLDEIDGVRSFAFSEDGKFLAMRRYGKDAQPSPADGGGRRGPGGPPSASEGGADLVVRDLATGIDTNFGNVSGFAWTDEGAMLAMTVDAEGKAGNGVRVFDPATGRLRTLDSGDARYRALAWREDAADLAVLKVVEHDEDAGEDETIEVLAWRGLDGPDPRRTAYDHLADSSFPVDMRVVDYAGVRWADDGAAVFFGIAAWKRRPKIEADEQPGIGDDGDAGEAAPVEASSRPAGKRSEPGDEAKKTLRESLDKPAGVEVWHARDIEIIPRQKLTLARDRRLNHLCALWLDDGRFVRLGDDLTETVRLVEGQRRALGLDNTPYEAEKRFGPTVYDVYAIDARTGDKRRLLDRVKYAFGSSPNGRYVTFVREGDVWAWDLQSGGAANLTEGARSEFINQEVSSLTDEKPPYGIAGWSDDSQHVLLYDRYDVWMFRADGGGHERLTRGAEERIRHRLVRLDPDEEAFDLDEPIWVSLYGDTSKRSGYGRLRVGEPFERLLFVDQNVSGLQRAEDADVFVYAAQAYDDSPDLFATSGDLDAPRQVTDTNPFQDEYAWGRSELVGYENEHGQALQGALFYPADYRPGERYPMIVYIYELRSQQLHGYVAPSERRPYNTSVFTTQGYFVFQPDIVYRPQNPGLSALECVVPAVRKVLENGKIDPERVGLVGHSWGAYQTAFLVTHCDLFAAGVAGAPLTNMMSMSMSIYWNSGQTDAHIFHESQGRMDRPFWRDLDTYIKNSPIFGIEDLDTPLLIAFGDQDGAVDWQQGIEMYNAARLAQKPLVMLTYPGENHSLRKKENQVDYHYRVRAWFDHYLKGVPAPEWITSGRSWLDRQDELEELELERKNEKKAPKDKGGVPERTPARRRLGPG